MMSIPPLGQTMRIAGYALRGGQEDALNELREQYKRLETLTALGADVDARIRDAEMLEMAGVPSDLIPLIARIWASGRITARDAHHLRAEHGITIDREEPR